jgi:glycine/D-amino acid oxidase-like deaminating enzyme
MSASLPEHVDVVIAGGGITGASCFYHLTTRTDLDVLLLEARGVNFGSTARSAAAFRHQFSSRVNVQMSRYSGRLFNELHNEHDTETLLVQNGYLFLYGNEETFQHATNRVEFQQEAGVDTVRTLEPDAVQNKFPHIQTDELVGATWCPQDGFVRPERTTRAFINLAFEHENAFLQQNCPVTEVHLENGQLHGIEANGETTVRTTHLVNAAGVWCQQIARAMDLTLPVAPVKRYLYFTNQFDDRDVTGYPMTVRDLGAYMRPEHNGLMLGWDRKPHAPSSPDAYWRQDYNYDRLYDDQDELEEGYGLGIDGYGYEVLAAWAEWVPFLEQAALTNVSSGFYQVTPDSKAIVSRDPRVEGVLHAVGFSGHGVMHAPATGRAITDLITERDSPFDLEALKLDPFLEDRQRSDPEQMVL